MIDERSDTRPRARGTDFLAGGGEMGARMRAYDWSQSSLGPPETWPQSLKTAIGIVLASRYAMWMLWGPDLTFFCNDAYRPTLGVKGTWALGARSDRVWEEIWPDIGPRIDHVLETGEATWDEGLLLFLERSGFPEESYHTFSYSPLTDNAGAIAGMLCVVTEETERVVGDRRLRLLGGLGGRLARSRTREAVYEAVAQSLAETPDDVPAALLYLFDGQGTARLARAVGFPAGHPAAAPAIAAGAAEAWPLSAVGAEAVLVEAMPGGGPPLGRPGWGRPIAGALLAPILGQGEDRPVGVLVAALNPHRPLDAGYRGFVGLLAGQVAAGLASAEAYEAELRRAEALAELDRARTVFFSNVSHEFRTPLTLMLSPLEEVLAGPGAALPADTRLLVTVAHRNGLRLLRLVNALLDFSRVEAGRATARFEPVDLAGLTAELAGNFRSLCEQAGLAFAVDCPALAEPVAVDRDMWEKVVLNLLSNAFKFTFEGGIAVSLGAEGDRVVLAVSDTGIGIPAAEVPRLFERFHRVEGARGRTIEGSGIGLALVQELVRLHQGEIAVESAPDRGSTFRVSLPLGRAVTEPGAVPPRAAASTAVRAEAFVEEARRWLEGTAGVPDAVAELRDLLPADAAPRTGAAGGRVLLADDNADMREHLRRLLAREGYAVVAVADGQAALERACDDRPDLILTDVMMPRLDGFGLLQAVRADPRLREVPVIVLSARAGDEAKVEGLDAGADDYLTKPFSARELLARVGANLQLARVRREAADALRSLNASLESEVAERTAERDRVWRDSRDLLAVLGKDGVFRAVNPAWTAILGLDPAEVEGRSFLDFIWPEDAQASRAALDEAAAGRNLTGFEDRYRHADGSPRWISWHTSREGDLVYAYGREVSAEKSQAEALRQTEEALRQSQKLEAVGQLTGGVAHDFNNLLTIIRSSVDFLRRPNLPEERRRRYLEAVSDTVDRAAKLTSQLLAFARRQALKPETFEVGLVLRAMADMIDTVTGARVAVVTELPEMRCYVHADLSQFETALVNMAVNARDAMNGEGMLTLRLTCGGRLPMIRGHAGSAAPFVAIALADTGSGIPPEVLGRIFEPFFTTKEVGKGTGLGLSQVFGFAKQSGGNVDVTTALGHGTTFVLYLPEVSPEADPEPEEAAERPVPAGAGRRVLVVEDNVEVGRFATQTLQDLGYVTTWAANADEALACLEADPAGFDVVFTDVVMPRMNGVELAREIRRRRPGLPVVLASGYSHVLAEEGHHGFELLQKPYSVEDLSRVLRQVTRRRRAPRSAG
ncbi:Sensor histidine kinase TmoS [Methylobacterium dankookense]|uniref:histidine kinase n=2 Tax=Methylobacterium dankookense TaxID=560405 RepID=A0A564G5U5_9HYPH|nr:Sensor histidine kinase TmoS [Methylobacterium dankookense]